MEEFETLKNSKLYYICEEELNHKYSNYKQ